jgi:hypothetical protein
VKGGKRPDSVAALQPRQFFESGHFPSLKCLAIDCVKCIERSLTAVRCLIDGKLVSEVLRNRMAKELKETDGDITALTVRVPRALVSNIDHERKARAVRVPRNTWILEAVVEKLDREKQGQHNGFGQGANDGEK